MKNVAVFASGSGSNFQALINAQKKHKFCNLKLLIASNENIYAIERAKKADIDYEVFSKKNYIDLENMFLDIEKTLKKHQIDFIVLAGYLTILPNSFIKKYDNKIINIHPSLLPSFGGGGCYGINVHKMALDYGVKVSGCTVHFVKEQIDSGAIILQSTTVVKDNDTPKTLQARILKSEHRILPKALELLTKNKLEIIGRRVKIKEQL